MKPFILSERISRLAFQNFAAAHPYPDFWSITEHPIYSSIDVTMFSGASIVNAEIKARPRSHKFQYPGKPQGWIIEKDKYCDLTGATNCRWYINIFSDAVVIWDVDAMKPDWQQDEFNKYTEVDKGKKVKHVHYLQLSDALYIGQHTTDFDALKAEVLKNQSQ